MEDNRNFLRVMAYFITEMGLDPAPAQSAEEGLEILSKQPIALVITDVRMPGMDGLQFVKAASQRQKDLPFIVARTCSNTTLGPC